MRYTGYTYVVSGLSAVDGDSGVQRYRWFREYAMEVVRGHDYHKGPMQCKSSYMHIVMYPDLILDGRAVGFSNNPDRV